MNTNKSWIERAAHALVFEILALAICAPVLAWAMGSSMAHAGLLTLMISLIAMLWNMIFNTLFERVERHWGLVRTFAVRVMHAVAFEAGLVAAVVPLAAWWLKISWFDALLLDIGLLLFFLPYTVVFNWAYDKLRETFIKRRSAVRL
ncbi:multidrug/biocide efflux PACE transporter [Paraherbaspirillum soli]|uniref:Multidrug/biocide efflux PACE transporter n=1 Tax=Paraherbaspirillum soli TaxID=631222 RepID=A0ABW0MAD9_9BURK